MDFRKTLLFILLLLIWAPTTLTAQYEEGNRRVKLELISDHEGVQPVDSFDTPVARIGVNLKIEDGWHIYWKNSGEAALPTSVKFSLPDGWRIGELQWPVPKKFLERGDVTTYGYNKEVLLFAELFAPIVIPKNNDVVRIEAEITFLVCHDICVPGRNNIELLLPFSTEKPLTPSRHFSVFEQAAKQVPRPIGSSTGFLASLDVKSVFAFSSADAKRGEILILIPSIAGGAAAEINEMLQIFPEVADSIFFGPPVLIRQDESFSVVSLPLEIVGEAPESISYVLAVADKLSGESHPSGIQATVSLGTGAKKNPELERLVSQIGSIERLDNPKPLKYREYDYSSGPESNAGRTKKVDSSLAVILLFAFIAGVILNLMPCVLPILSIKVMAILNKAEQTRGYVLRSATIYSLGIISSLVALSLVIVSLRFFGQDLGWGFQFQSAQFVLALTVVVFVLALGFFDLYHFSMPFTQSANRAAGKVQTPMLKHFFDGVLMTVLSTPCTAPFLGTVLVFALTSPPYITILVFVFIGLGLSFPYFYLATNPKLINYLPKPGNWMFRVREVMGFLLLGTVVWLLFVLSKLTEDGVVWTLVAMLLFYFYFWLKKILGQSKLSVTAKRNWRVSVFVIVILLVCLIVPKILVARTISGSYETELISWIPFSESAVNEAAEQNKIVFIDFTAEWCITCKANEKLAIETTSVSEAIKNLNVVAIKGDWTTGDEKITQALAKYGAKGVPHYVVIPANGGEPEILPSLLTSDIVVEALQQAAQ